MDFIYRWHVSFKRPFKVSTGSKRKDNSTSIWLMKGEKMIKRKVFKSEVHRRRKEGNRGKDYKPSSKSHFGILSLSLRLCEQNYWISNLFFNPFFASAIWAWIIFVTQSRELLHGFQFINLFWEDCPRFKVCCFFICLTRINTHHFQLLQQQFPYLALVKNC